jgi:hypothetical protein
MSEQPVLCKFKSLTALRTVKSELAAPGKAGPATSAHASKAAETDAALTWSFRLSLPGMD